MAWLVLDLERDRLREPIASAVKDVVDTPEEAGERRPRLVPRLVPRRLFRAIRADSKMPKTRFGSGLSPGRGDWI